MEGAPERSQKGGNDVNTVLIYEILKKYKKNEQIKINSKKC